MAIIIIRNLDDDLKFRQRVRAAENGRSLEEVARAILHKALGPSIPTRSLGQANHARLAVVEGAKVSAAQRGPHRAIPDLS